MSYGSGKYTYELDTKWQAQFPNGWVPMEVNALAVDSKDRLYAFNTGDYPVTVFDRSGKLLSSWGQKIFNHSHGAVITDDAIWWADDGNHTVVKSTLDGKVLMTLGNKDKPSDTGYTLVDKDGKSIFILDAIYLTKKSGPPFNSPTDVKVSSKGEIFVADGYGNARIHKFSADGKLLLSWGDPGKGKGQFVVPHSVAVDKNGRVLVADRHNNRIQIFDSNGKYLTEWTDVVMPTHIYIDKDQTVYVSELVPARVSIFNLDGKLLARWGNEGRTEKDPLFCALHNIVTDSRGDLYVCEVMGIYKPDDPFYVSRKTRMIQKFIRK